MSTTYYVYKRTQSLCFLRNKKSGIVRLVALTGPKKGDKFEVTKEGFARNFKKISKAEIGEFFKEKEPQRIILPERELWLPEVKSSQ